MCSDKAYGRDIPIIIMNKMIVKKLEKNSHKNDTRPKKGICIKGNVTHI